VWTLVVPGARLVSCRTIGFRSADYHLLIFAGGDSTESRAICHRSKAAPSSILPACFWPVLL
jgi:hypothetical protein